MHEFEGLYKVARVVTQWVGSISSIMVHTLFFIFCFVAVWLHWVPFDQMLLALTTVVSLEAIYLAIFIQMTVNLQSESIEEVEKDIDEIQEDIDEMQEDVEEIQEDVEDIEEDGDLDDARQAEERKALEAIQADIRKLLGDIEKVKEAHRSPEPTSAAKQPEAAPYEPSARPAKKTAKKTIALAKSRPKSKRIPEKK